MSPEQEVSINSCIEALEAQFIKPLACLAGEWLVGELCRCRSLPQRERFGQRGTLTATIASGARHARRIRCQSEPPSPTWRSAPVRLTRRSAAERIGSSFDCRRPRMSWKLEGSYFETCSCDVVCPC